MRKTEEEITALVPLTDSDRIKYSAEIAEA